MTDRSRVQNAANDKDQASPAQHHVDRASDAETGMQSAARGSVMMTDEAYWVGPRLGKGGFGAVFAGIRLSDNMKVAVKVEPHGTKIKQLKEERRVYAMLSSSPDGIVRCLDGIVSHLDSGDSYHPVNVMELLGASLQNLFETCQRRFTLRTAAAVGIEMLQRLKELHEDGFIHQDVKPDNFMLRASPKPFDLVTIDISMVKRFRNNESSNRQVVGTRRYMSRRMHDGLAQSRRDDLESLWYVLIYFVLGRLPWQGLQDKTEIGAIKRATSPNELCKDCPELAAGFHHIDGLRFDEAPDYELLRNTLSKAAGGLDKDVQCGYDWECRPQTTKPDFAIDAAPIRSRMSPAQSRIIADIPNDRNGILHRLLEEGRILGDHLAFLELMRRDDPVYFEYYNEKSWEPFETFNKFTRGAGYRLGKKQQQEDIQRRLMNEERQVQTDGFLKDLKPILDRSEAVETALILGTRAEAEKAMKELKASWDILKGIIEDELKSPPHEIREGQRREGQQSLGAVKRQNDLEVPMRPAKRQSTDDLRQGQVGTPG